MRAPRLLWSLLGCMVVVVFMGLEPSGLVAEVGQAGTEVLDQLSDPAVVGVVGSVDVPGVPGEACLSGLAGGPQDCGGCCQLNWAPADGTQTFTVYYECGSGGAVFTDPEDIPPAKRCPIDIETSDKIITTYKSPTGGCPSAPPNGGTFCQVDCCGGGGSSASCSWPGISGFRIGDSCPCYNEARPIIANWGGGGGFVFHCTICSI